MGTALSYTASAALVQNSVFHAKNLISDFSLRYTCKKEYIIQNGYDITYGARPLKRYISHTVETILAKEIIKQDISPNTQVIVDADKTGIIIKTK